MEKKSTPTPGAHDVIEGSRNQARNERINGLGGNDTLRGNGGDDILDGGDGGNGGQNILSGGDGNDVLMNIGTMGLNPSALSAVGEGGAGDDAIFVGNRITDLTQRIADSAIEQGNADFGAAINGGEGNDRIVGSASGDVIMGGADRDLIIAGGGADVIIGDGSAANALGNGFVYALNSANYTERRGFVVGGQPDGFANTSVIVEAGSRVTPGADPTSQLLLHPQATAGADDTIHAGGGSDYALGDGGNDTLYASQRNRTRTTRGGISRRRHRRSNTPIGGRFRAKVAGSGRLYCTFQVYENERTSNKQANT